MQGLKIELVLLTAGLPILCNEMGYYGKCKSISAAVESAVPMSQITTIKNYTILTWASNFTYWASEISLLKSPGLVRLGRKFQHLVYMY